MTTVKHSPSRSTARQKLDRSRLRPDQLEGMGDVDVRNIILRTKGHLGISVTTRITDIILERTIEGASTVTVECVDDDRSLLRSGTIGRNTDIEIDGLFFRLSNFKKSGERISLIFEDREVALLRTYFKKRIALRSQMTRAEFVLQLLKEVKEERIPYYIPQLHKVQPIQTKLDTQTYGQAAQAATPQGFPPGSTAPQSRQRSPMGQADPQGGQKTYGGLTIKDRTATKSQLNNAAQILATGISMGARRKVLVTAIMTAIQESTLRNLPGGDRDSVGLFQQRASWGSFADRHDPATASRLFFRSAIKEDKANPGLPYWQLAQNVQNSANGRLYDQWRTEANAIVTTYGSPGKDATGSAAGANLSGTSSFTGTAVYHYFRGVPPSSNHPKWGHENSWTCFQRLAQEVNWRAFFVSGKFYFVDEDFLFKSRPLMRISESTPGVDRIDFDYDRNKKSAVCSIVCHAKRWQAPPGSVIILFDMGPANGRWLVSQVRRSMFNTDAEITIKKPLPQLPEPSKDAMQAAQQTGWGSKDGDPGGGPASEISTGLGSKAEQALAYALQQLGDPYKWGAEGPDRFDCSGLTMAAYATVGIRLPHNAELQWQHGKKLLPGAALMAGDLLFFGRPSGGPNPQGLHHVGMYTGHGHQMVDAPHSGANVRLEDYTSWPDFYGATRPVAVR